VTALPTGNRNAPAAHRRAARAFLDELRRRDPDGRMLRKKGDADTDALARQAATTVVDAATVWQEALGTFYDVEAVRGMLGRAGTPVSRQAVSKRPDLLALRTGSGRVVYPTFQFRGNTPLPGLGDVLAALPPEIVTRWTVASWLVSPARELDGQRPVDVLAEGGGPAVVAAAEAWATGLRA
jgi:hypothetical protein